jgi:hypothetical protein
MTYLDELLFDSTPAERSVILAALSAALVDAPEVAFAFLHGSFGKVGRYHDIDIAVYFVGLDDEAIGRRMADLARGLEDAAFGANKTRPHPPIDVRALNHAPLGFGYQVLRSGQLLANRDDKLRTEWTESMISRYLDIKPLYEAALKEAMISWH